MKHYTSLSLTYAGQSGTGSWNVRKSQSTSRRITHSQAGQYSKKSIAGDHHASWKIKPTPLNTSPFLKHKFNINLFSIKQHRLLNNADGKKNKKKQGWPLWGRQVVLWPPVNPSKLRPDMTRRGAATHPGSASFPKPLWRRCKHAIKMQMKINNHISSKFETVL